MKFLHVLAVFLAAVPALAQTPEDALDSVLARAGAYVVEFQRSLSGIVAEEHYRQDVRVPTMLGSALRFSPTAGSASSR